MESKFYNREIIDIAELQNHYYEISYSEWCILWELQKKTFVLRTMANDSCKIIRDL